MMRILVVEDEASLRDALTTGLRSAGFAVDPADNLADAQLHLKVSEYNAIVADRMLPDGDAIDLVSDLRRSGNRVPLLFLTARDTVEDRVEGFEQGGDDYLIKPFAMQELIVRVRSLCRRPTTLLEPIVRIGDLEIDRSRTEVRKDNVLLPLTPKEWCILIELTASPNVALSRSHLIEHCWDEHNDPMSNVVDAHMKSLRRKLGAPNPIRTIRGVGFILDTETN